MIQNKKILAIVPARQNSKRLKNKNFLSFGGRPLLSFTIQKLLKIKIIDKIIITTDKKNFNLSLNKNNKIEFHNRQKKYSTSRSPVFNTIFDLAKKYDNYDIISYFLPTVPFTSLRDIKFGYERVLKFKTCVSIVEYEDPIEIALRYNSNSKLIKPLFQNLSRNKTNSKLLEKSYRPSGAFYITHRKSLLKNKTFFVKNTCGINYTSPYFVDINNSKDFEYAKFILKYRFNEKKN
tara:strand:+ start:644 stop:1348 length:705 start_codon:yes stop_codon:yes gene_type:complete